MSRPVSTAGGGGGTVEGTGVRSGRRDRDSFESTCED